MVSDTDLVGLALTVLCLGFRDDLGRMTVGARTGHKGPLPSTASTDAFARVAKAWPSPDHAEAATPGESPRHGVAGLRGIPVASVCD